MGTYSLPSTAAGKGINSTESRNPWLTHVAQPVAQRRSPPAAGPVCCHCRTAACPSPGPNLMNFQPCQKANGMSLRITTKSVMLAGCAGCSAGGARRMHQGRLHLARLAGRQGVHASPAGCPLGACPHSPCAAARSCPRWAGGTGGSSCRGPARRCTASCSARQCPAAEGVAQECGRWASCQALPACLLRAGWALGCCAGLAQHSRVDASRHPDSRARQGSQPLSARSAWRSGWPAAPQSSLPARGQSGPPGPQSAAAAAAAAAAASAVA
jgi:hypothetical protein